MRMMEKISLALYLECFAFVTAAATQNFFGTYEGTGRACSGSLNVREKSVEWRSAFSVCHTARYEALEKNNNSNPKRIVLHLEKTAKECRYPVIEMEQAGNYNWNVTGYPSLEAYRNRKLPDWSNSSLPERQTLSCPMVGPN
ncbi:hypothetical protein [Paracidovorax cattleyae]|uniref:hypothetical protein n=1 Tax=Paracidovorax cattleyae TaxID=80868 RepID=UPI0018AFE966|nr:hypothetical protein [Paracidovorax cattleyae]MBF9265713.1 hypothetical protein [Paracidovorax cattleyae]